MQVELDDKDVEAIAGRVAQLITKQDVSPWLNAESAADYLDCVVSRIRKLTMTGELPVYREGGRVLYRRDELDLFVANGGGNTH